MREDPSDASRFAWGKKFRLVSLSTDARTRKTKSISSTPSPMTSIALCHHDIQWKTRKMYHKWQGCHDMKHDNVSSSPSRKKDEVLTFVIRKLDLSSIISSVKPFEDLKALYCSILRWSLSVSVVLSTKKEEEITTKLQRRKGEVSWFAIWMQEFMHMIYLLNKWTSAPASNW